MTPRALFHPARLARRPVLSTQSDERLVDLVRAGSEPAFETIVERYRRALMRYVSRLLPPERAEDVVQQAFVKAYEAMHRDAADLHLKPWLYRIAHNGALNALRDRALSHAQLDERLDGVERPDQALERRTGLRELVVAVQALPERQRDAILLRELEGRSYEEIASALGVTGGAVRQLLNRARNSLRATAAALTPAPLVERVAAGDSAEPVAELVGLGGSALAMKVCATALVTGAVVGGAAVVPDLGREHSTVAPPSAEAARAEGEDGVPTTIEDSAGGDTGEQSGSSGDTSGSGQRGGESGRGGIDGGRADDRSGRGGSDPGDDREGTSGPSGAEEDDHSGPGGGDDPDGSGPDGTTGPGAGGSGDGVSGGSGSSGSGSSGGPDSGELTSTPEYTTEERSGSSGGGDYPGGGSLTGADYTSSSGPGPGY
jgi:RNA polymerase sigma factor (sigma-70 family)